MCVCGLRTVMQAGRQWRVLPWGVLPWGNNWAAVGRPAPDEEPPAVGALLFAAGRGIGAAGG